MQTFPIKNLLTGEILDCAIDEWVALKTVTITPDEATAQLKAGYKKYSFFYQPIQQPKTVNFSSPQNTQPIKAAKKCNCR